MDIYLKLDEKHFYYFGYTRGVMQVLSNNELVQEYLHHIDLAHRSMQVSSNETGYLYIIAADSKFGGFLRRYKQKLSGDSANSTEQQQDEQDNGQGDDSQNDSNKKNNVPPK